MDPASTRAYDAAVASTMFDIGRLRRLSHDEAIETAIEFAAALVRCDMGIQAMQRQIADLKAQVRRLVEG